MPVARFSPLTMLEARCSISPCSTAQSAALYNTSGIEVASYTYSAYGKTDPSGAADQNKPFRYVEGIQDVKSSANSSVYKLGARYTSAPPSWTPTCISLPTSWSVSWRISSTPALPPSLLGFCPPAAGGGWDVSSRTEDRWILVAGRHQHVSGRASRMSRVPASLLGSPISARDSIRRCGAERTSTWWRVNEAGLRVRHVAEVKVHHDVRPTVAAWLRRKAFYGTSAAPRAKRQGDRMAPAVMSPVTAVAVGGILKQRRWYVVVALVAAAVTLGQASSAVPDLPLAERRRLVRATAAGRFRGRDGSLSVVDVVEPGRVGLGSVGPVVELDDDPPGPDVAGVDRGSDQC